MISRVSITRDRSVERLSKSNTEVVGTGSEKDTTRVALRPIAFSSNYDVPSGRWPSREMADSFIGKEALLPSEAYARAIRRRHDPH